MSLATSTGASTSPSSGARVVQLYPAPPPTYSVTTAAYQPLVAPPVLANQLLWRDSSARGSIPHPPDLSWRGTGSHEPLAASGPSTRAEARRARGSLVAGRVIYPTRTWGLTFTTLHICGKRPVILNGIPHVCTEV